MADNRYSPPDWIREALEALRPPRRERVSEWADRCRILGEGQSSKPGRWRTSYTPYLRELMDAFNDPEVEEISFVKCTQVGGTEAELNMIGAALCNDPAPILMVLPQKELAQLVSERRIQPMIRACPELARQYLEGSKWDDLGFRSGVSIGIVGANSPSDLASRAVRYLFLDEEDKFPARSGKESAPAALARERLKTYPGSKKMVRMSTPVFEDGPTWQAWLKADTRMECFVTCPHCHAEWTYKFGRLKWPEGATADQALAQAVYLCEECDAVISEADRAEMLQSCRWKAVETNGSRRRIAFRLNVFYSPWVRLGEVAANWIESESAPELRQNFINSWLAEPYKEIDRQMDAETLLETRQGQYPAGRVPPDTVMLTGGVDVQKRCLYWTVRAWRVNMTSFNVAHGQAFSWGELERVMNAWYEDAQGGKYQVNLCLVDAGYETDTVFDFCAVNSSWAVASRGSSSRMQSKYRAGRIERNGMADGQLMLWVDTDFYKDMIFSRLFRAVENGGWFLHDGCDPEYAEQITAEHKVIERRRGHLVSRWEQKVSGGDNHYLDCEVYAACAADVYGLRTIYSRQAQTEHPSPQPESRPERPRRHGKSFRRRGSV